MDEFVCFNGNIQPVKDVKISPLNRGMMYGDGCFETIRSYAGKFLDLEAHYKRLSTAFKYLNIDLTLSHEDLHHSIQALLEVNKIEKEQAMIRFQCWRKGDRGYKTNSREFDWIITSSLVEIQVSTPVRLITAKTPVIPSKALNRTIKLSNGLNYIIAAQEAEQQHVDDALMLTMNGNVSETTISNIFWGSGNSIFTPSDECDLLPGVTRKLMFEVFDKSKYEIKIGNFNLEDLKSSDFAFTTNSISEIRAVESIDNYHFESNHIELIRIKSMFEALKNERFK